MGKKNKNKNKAREPDGTHLVVVHPWGQPNHPNFINNVAAWFEVMLADDFHDMRVETIYTHKQHTNIILEFPSQFDPSPYLGAHSWTSFLSSPWNTLPETQNRQSFVYAYNFAKYLEPGPRGWKTNMPTYDRIPKNFPIQSPYPNPGPAPLPGMEVPYAIPPRTLPPAIPPPATTPGWDSDIKVEEGTRGKKGACVDDFLNSIDIDLKPPVEKEDMGATPDFKPSVKHEALADTSRPRVKEEFPDETVLNRLPSPPRIKAEPIDLPLRPLKVEQEDVKQVIKPEPSLPSYVEPNMSDDEEEEEGEEEGEEAPPRPMEDENEDGYQPSAELMAAFAGLPEDFFSGMNAGSPHHEDAEPPTRVKDEPMDDNSFDNLRERSMTLATDYSTPQPAFARNHPPTPPPAHPHRQETRIKPEPQDTFMIPPIPNRPPSTHASTSTASARIYDRSRDPRLARMQGIKREPEDLDVRGQGVKKVKLEYQ